MSPIPCCLHPSFWFLASIFEDKTGMFPSPTKMGYDGIPRVKWIRCKNWRCPKRVETHGDLMASPHEVKLQPCRGSWPICRSYRRERVEHPEAIEYMKWRAKWCKMSWYWRLWRYFGGQMGWPIEFKVDLATVSGRGDIPIWYMATMRSWESPCLYPRYS